MILLPKNSIIENARHIVVMQLPVGLTYKTLVIGELVGISL
jgi:hypothetical protein